MQETHTLCTLHIGIENRFAHTFEKQYTQRMLYVLFYNISLDFCVFVPVTWAYINGFPIVDTATKDLLKLSSAMELVRPFPHFYARCWTFTLAPVLYACSATFVPTGLKTVTLGHLLRFKKTRKSCLCYNRIFIDIKFQHKWNFFFKSVNI